MIKKVVDWTQTTSWLVSIGCEKSNECFYVLLRVQVVLRCLTTSPYGPWFGEKCDSVARVCNDERHFRPARPDTSCFVHDCRRSLLSISGWHWRSHSSELSLSPSTALVLCVESVVRHQIMYHFFLHKTGNLFFPLFYSLLKK